MFEIKCTTCVAYKVDLKDFRKTTRKASSCPSPNLRGIQGRLKRLLKDHLRVLLRSKSYRELSGTLLSLPILKRGHPAEKQSCKRRITPLLPPLCSSLPTLKRPSAFSPQDTYCTVQYLLCTVISTNVP